MKKLKLILVLIAVITFTACKNQSDSSDDTEEVSTYSDEEVSESYPDGTYCAEIEYYNPDTGTQSTYTLNVEVESNELVVIQWPNGGWLDSSHFSPEELDSSGSCSFTTYDGNQYDIQIIGSECSYTDNARVISDAEETKCSNCGGKKYSYDQICDDCERKQKDKAEHTCKRCGEYDTFMWSSDELCSDCKRDDEDKEREEKRRMEEEQEEQ